MYAIVCGTHTRITKRTVLVGLCTLFVNNCSIRRSRHMNYFVPTFTELCLPPSPLAADTFIETKGNSFHIFLKNSLVCPLKVGVPS